MRIDSTLGVSGGHVQTLLWDSEDKTVKIKNPVFIFEQIAGIPAGHAGSAYTDPFVQTAGIMSILCCNPCYFPKAQIFLQLPSKKRKT